MIPGEFASRVCASVEEGHASIVAIDSLNGYLTVMPEERYLSAHLHELLAFLGQRGVMTVLVMAQHGLLGAGMAPPVDVSYLSDAVLLLRWFEARSEIRRAISVVKKRSGYHERTIREFRLGSDGIRVGDQLEHLHGILTGVPTHRGGTAGLFDDDGGWG
jgi:circadian clock protein KaiC